MDNGRIAYFEDNQILAESMQAGIDLFSDGRHKVVAHAADLGGALAVLDQIGSGELDANVVLSDGNLSPGIGGRDAREIMERVAELGLDVRTVLMSSQTAEEIGVNVDVGMKKDEVTGAGLIEVIDGLAELGA